MQRGDPFYTLLFLIAWFGAAAWATRVAWKSGHRDGAFLVGMASLALPILGWCLAWYFSKHPIASEKPRE